MLVACAHAAETGETAEIGIAEGEGTETLTADLAVAPDAALISDPPVTRSESPYDLKEISSDVGASEAKDKDFLASEDIPDLSRAIEELERELNEDGDEELEEGEANFDEEEDAVDTHLKMVDETRMYDDEDDEDDLEGDDEYAEELEKFNHMFDNESYDDEYDGEEDGDYDENDELNLENLQRQEDKSGEFDGAKDEEIQMEEADPFSDTEENEMVEIEKENSGDRVANVTVGEAEPEISTKSSDEKTRAREASIDVMQGIKIET